VCFEESADAARGESSAEAIEEHCESLFFGCLGVGLSHFEPVIECSRGVAADGCESFFSAFSEDSNDAGSAIPV